MERETPGQYGARVEVWVTDRYDLDRTFPTVRGNKFDAETADGRPVEIKAVAANRRGGRANSVSVKVWQDQHESLRDAGGYYVFVLYEMIPSGVGIIEHRSVRAADIRPEWYGRTEPRGEKQAEIPAKRLF